jgi:hypothetical protein
VLTIDAHFVFAGTSKITIQLTQRNYKNWRIATDVFNVGEKLRRALGQAGIDVTSSANSIFSVKSGVNINGRTWRVGFYAEFTGIGQSSRFGRVASFFYVRAPEFHRSYVLLEMHELMERDPFISVSSDVGGAQVLIPCTDLQFLLKSAPDSEDENRMYLIRVSATV